MNDENFHKWFVKDKKKTPVLVGVLGSKKISYLNLTCKLPKYLSSLVWISIL